jgi:hypothetical protein
MRQREYGIKAELGSTCEHCFFILVQPITHYARELYAPVQITMKGLTQKS